MDLAHISGAPVGVFDQCVSPGDVLAVWVVMLLNDQKLLHCSLLSSLYWSVGGLCSQINFLH